MKRTLSTQQEAQEKEYALPYHYRDLFSEEHALLRDVEYLSYLHQVKKELPRTGKPLQLMDVGCGDGRFFYELRNEKIEAQGIDYSPQAIRFAQAFNPQARFWAGDIRKFPHSGKFDVVTLIEVVEHFPPKDIPSILSAIREHMKENGKLIVTVPSTRRRMVEKHYQHFTVESLTRTLEPYFVVEKIEGYSKVGVKKTIFNVLRKIAVLWFPLRKRMGWVDHLIGGVRRYYATHLSSGEPEECEGLLAVASIKKN